MLLTKSILIKTAMDCHSFTEMSHKLNIGPSYNNKSLTIHISNRIKQYGLYEKIREIFRINRQTNPVSTKKYTIESIIEIAHKNKTLKGMGKFLGVTRERVRQILEKLNIRNEVYGIFELNKYNIKRPEKNISGVFSLYFKNDPDSLKFFAHSTDIRRALTGYCSWMKMGEKMSHPLIQACIKYGLKNLKWEVIKECHPSDLKKEADTIIKENINHSMNLRTIRISPDRSKILKQRRTEWINKFRKPKESKYPGVYYHRQSGLWMANPVIPGKGKQKYLGYYRDEEEANKVINKWRKVYDTN